MDGTPIPDAREPARAQNKTQATTQIPGKTHPPAAKPANPNFSSGPCAKPPGWSLSSIDTQWLGRSHRATGPKADIQRAIKRCHALMQLPDDWLLGIVPGSDTGAFEMAMWSLLGRRNVDAFVWESFSSDWATDLQLLDLPNLNVHKAAYGQLPDFSKADPANDLVMVANGTTSGVRVPDFNFIDADREGLVLCDATSAVFAIPLDYERLDVVTWSWQKVLGGEAAHGMLALSPRAVQRLEEAAPRAVPKLFRLAKDGQLIKGIFDGSTINTPSMLAIADLHHVLDWAESAGGNAGLMQRSERNFEIINSWVQQNDWVDWLAAQINTRSTTSMCLSITDQKFNALDDDQQKSALKFMLKLLEAHDAAYDIGNYRSAPTGFRIWGGATVETSDLELLTDWLDWAWLSWQEQNNSLTTQGGTQT